METIGIIKIVVAAAAAAYEIISRVIPTESRWSIIGKVLEILQRISDVFDKNNRKRLKNA